MIDKELKIWAAGLFDGEGSALIEKTGPDREGLQITVAVAASDERATNPIKEVWGGHYRANRDLNACKRTDHSIRKLDCSVYFTRKEAKKFLADILPYLRLKQEEARIMLQALYAAPDEEELKKQGRKRACKGYSETLRPFYWRLQSLR